MKSLGRRLNSSKAMRLLSLPPNLLDLTLVRTYSASTSLRQGAVAVKYASRSHAMKRPVAVYPGSLAKFRPAQPEYRELEKGTETASAVSNLREPKEKLSERVKALEEVAAVEKAALEESTYSEQELLALYADLLTVQPEYKHGIEESDTAPIQKPDDKLVIASVEQRLFAEPALQEEDRGDEPSRVLSTGSRFNGESTSAHRRILAHVHEFVQRVEGTRSQASAGLNAVRSGTQSPDKQMVPVSILTLAEHEALIRTAAYEHDHEAVDFALDLLRRTGLGVMEEAVNTVLEIYAAEGNPTAFEHILGKYLTANPTDTQRHLHIKSHIKAAPANAIPNSALSLLHSYEQQSLPAPMKTYTSVISTLFKTRKSVARAQAWDLFSHMRYVAHPNPDAFLYAVMIRACAYPISASLSSEPERALDLWTEMTVDRSIPPTSQAYNAVILACARSGSEVYINEAFRLAKQMLDSHRDAYGRSAFKPTRSTFLALLEGAKRIGDLARARYILAQMVTEQSQRPNILVDDCVNEQVMVHVFQTYSAYKPPFKRSQTLFVNQTQQSQPQPAEVEHQGQDASAEQQIPGHDTSIIQQASLFTHIPPQTPTEVIAEVKILFDSILQDHGIAADQAVPAEEIFPTSGAKFRHVTITSRLINAYLSIHFRHSSLEASRELFWSLYDKCNVVRSPRCYVDALEACSITKPGYDRTVAVQFADELWKQWMIIEETWNDTHRGRLDTRLVERAHVAMIRLLALTDNVDRALQHVRMFEKRYPSSDVRKASAKPAFRSTRTSLTGVRPLVRVTTDANVPDDTVPPLLMFQDLELLHHRLVARGAAAEISYIKYLCKSYEWALRIRRDETMKARPEKTESSVALTS